MKPRHLGLITAAQVMALSIWFAGTVAGPGMAREGAVSAGFLALLTSAVQGGFVVGTLLSAGLGLADRVDPRLLFAAASVLGGVANASIVLLPIGADAVVVARFVTGVALAGVYPVGMKLAAGWADRRDAGVVIGLLVGGLTLGSAAPHLVNALGGLEWRLTLLAASLSAAAGAALMALVRLGPRHALAPRFHPQAALRLWQNRGTRLATLGYLGHMWELYAMWTWVGLYLSASFAAWRGGRADSGEAALATFAVIGVGAMGAVAAGVLADRFGRVRITVAAMAVSGFCCLLAGPIFGLHPALTIAVCVVWGVAVVADSAQFSAAIAELADPGLTGTMLTVQTSLGFALTLITIQLMPLWVGAMGWGWAFAVLALGPALGCVAMLRLGRSAAASLLAGGRG